VNNIEYKKHKPRDFIACNEYICNVCICKKCNAEFLLGLRCKCGYRGPAAYTIREYPTLLTRIQHGD